MFNGKREIFLLDLIHILNITFLRKQKLIILAFQDNKYTPFENSLTVFISFESLVSKYVRNDISNFLRSGGGNNYEEGQ